MAPRRLGEGARCSVLIKNLRPSREVEQRIVNPAPRQRATDLVAVRRGNITRGRRSYEAIFFTSPTFPDLELYAARKFTVVEQEGHADRLWETPLQADGTPAAAVTDDEGVAINENIFSDRADDIARVRAEGFEVDDDNEALPDNMPQPGAPAIEVNQDGLFRGQSWGWDGIDRRATSGGGYEEPSFTNGWSPHNKTYLEIFLHFLPFAWLQTVLLAKTNESIESGNSPPLSLGELMRYLGMRLLMSTLQGWSLEEYWCYEPLQRPQEEGPCPYNFRNYMSKKRFKMITDNLVFTDAAAPSFRDKFWQVRQMVKAWNENMALKFVAAWVMCLDESMSIWHNRWTCPGWIFCPRKPHPFGNEYHTACCGLSTILFVIEMVEGRDAPPELDVQYSHLGKTVGLLMRMLKSYFHTAKYVVLDSGFCVLKGIVKLREMGLFACALIKKRQSWPVGVPGDVMQARFDRPEMNVGDVDAISGTQDGTPYFLWGMKEPDYVMRMMATGGPNTPDESYKMTSRTWKRGNETMSVSFQYPRPFDWHFRYRHAVDDHNNLRHALPSIEDTWFTHRWECRVFSFILAITEINAFLALRYFVFANNTIEGCPTLLVFRRRLAWQLINNPWIRQDEQNAENTANTAVHQLCGAPEHARKWAGGTFICDATSQYQQYACSGKCGKRIRTYCVCDPSKWLCTRCLPAHVLEAEIEHS